ncbi:MAG: ABC transporter permease subunit [Oscillospiraceae bacterium]|nr:ABC transporter permease subunit [Oscillospiraceae bacterium]
MRELMKADRYRLKRDKVFWVCLLALLCVAVAMMYTGSGQCRALVKEGYSANLEQFCFRLSLAVELCMGVFTGLFLGTDHSEGALRNRLMVGHSREKVYLAALCLTMTAALCFTAAWLVGGGALALPNRDLWQMGGGQTALFLLVAISSALSLASILTVVGMLTEKKSAAAVSTILLVLFLILLSTWLHSRLQEPELETGLIMTAQGMQWGEPTPNPRYVGGALRQAYTLLLNVLPTGQAVLLTEMAVSRPLLNIGSSAAVTAVTTLLGIFLFRKKELK